MTDQKRYKQMIKQMIEAVINDDKTKGEELLHEFAVAKSRELYQSMLNDDIYQQEEGDEDDDMMSEIGGDPADDAIDDMEDDEFGPDEGDMEDDEFEFGPDEDEGDEPATKDDISDIRDALEELKAEFASMMDDMSNEGEAEDEDFGDEDEGEAEDEDFGDEDEGEAEDEEPKESFVREYTEKVPAAKMGDSGANVKSVVAKSNNMGGSSKNIAQGGTSSGGVKKVTPKDMNTNNVNVPGGNAGVRHLNKVSAAKSGDNGVNKKSSLGA